MRENARMLCPVGYCVLRGVRALYKLPGVVELSNVQANGCYLGEKS
jgi:hypothetical protein